MTHPEVAATLPICPSIGLHHRIGSLLQNGTRAQVYAASCRNSTTAHWRVIFEQYQVQSMLNFLAKPLVDLAHQNWSCKQVVPHHFGHQLLAARNQSSFIILGQTFVTTSLNYTCHNTTYSSASCKIIPLSLHQYCCPARARETSPQTNKQTNKQTNALSNPEWLLQSSPQSLSAF